MTKKKSEDPGLRAGTERAGSRYNGGKWHWRGVLKCDGKTLWCALATHQLQTKALVDAADEIKVLSR